MGYIPTRIIATNSMSGFRRELKKVLKCIIVSSKYAMTVDELNQDFMDVEGRSIPYCALGCFTITEYIQSLDDIFLVEPSTGIVKLLNLPYRSKSGHVRRLVQMDRSQEEHRERFIDSDSPPTNCLPNWNIMDVINQSPAVHFQHQLYTVVLLNRNKKGLTKDQFKSEMQKVLGVKDLDRSYGGVEKLLDKLRHLLYVSGDMIYPEMSAYSAEIQDLGLDRYYVPRIPIIPDSVKYAVLKILEDESHGMWAHYLPRLYQDTYGFVLDYWTFGFPTVTQFLATLPHLFRVVYFKGSYRIYATKTPYPPAPGVPLKDRHNVLTLLVRFLDGIEINYFEAIYSMMHNIPFSFEHMEFESLLEALQALSDHGVVVEMKGHETIVKLRSINLARSIPMVRPFYRKSIDDPPIECYPSSAMRPGDNIPRIVFDKDWLPGDGFKLRVQETYGPAAFFCNMDNDDCVQLQADLNAYYTDHDAELQMPFHASVEGLFCVAVHLKMYRRVLVIGEGFTHYDVNVLLIDYGGVIPAPKSSMFYLSKKFATTPNQAFFCYTANVEPANWRREFSPEADSMFIDLVHKKTLLAKVHKANWRNMEMGVVLTDTSNGETVDLRRALIDAEFANVSFKRPICDGKVYAAWSLFLRL